MHWSQNYQLESGEEIVAVFAQTMSQDSADINDDRSNLVLVTAKGRAKQTPLNEFTTFRSYKTRSAQAIKLQDASDRLVAAYQAHQDGHYDLVLLTRRSYGLRFNLDQISSQGLKAQGVMAIKLKDDDYVAAAFVIHQDLSRPQVFLLTQRGNVKRIDVAEFAASNRASVGNLILKELKAQPHRIIGAVALIKGNVPLLIQGDTGQQVELQAFDIPLTSRYNNGSTLADLDKLGQVTNLHIARLKLLDEQDD